MILFTFIVQVNQPPMKKILLYFIFTAFLSFSILAQTPKTRCGLDEVIQIDLNNNQSLKANYLQEINNAVNDILVYDTTLANTDTTYTVQVVVHVVYLNDNKYENIPDNIVQSQIDALNRDYNALNADTVNLRSMFVPFRGNAKIKFELAKVAPNGSPTTGITHTKGELGNLSGWDPISNILWTALNIEPLKLDYFLFGNSKGKTSWNVNKYMNIWVCDLNYGNRKCPSCVNLCDTCGALLGIAYPPANAINWGPLALSRGANDGLVIDFRAFGQDNWFSRDSASPRFKQYYSKGRTTVHEVGHYLGMQHSWGNVIPGLTPDGCAVDDFIDDTPVEVQAFASSIPDRDNPCDTSVNTCNKIYQGRDWPDMFEDYMDYSNDLCYNLFTKQQVNLMRYNLLTRRDGLIINRELSPSVPTSIKNISLAKAGISIFPNPASSSIMIHLDKASSKSLQIEIFDITGKIVSSKVMNKGVSDHVLDVRLLANGVYMLRFYNDQLHAVDKFVKE